MITGQDIIGCAPVIVVAFADCTAKSRNAFRSRQAVIFEE